MRRKFLVLTLTLLLVGTVFSKPIFSQAGPQKPDDDQPIRISTELVQVDVVVTDKMGKVVRGLTKDDFELFEKGKKQQLSFFEFVEAGKGRGRTGDVAKQPDVEVSPQGLAGAEVKRIFSFVVDDLTIPYQELVFVRQMLTNFVDKQMQPTDLVSIVRTVGGKGLLQQLTSDKDMLRRAIAAQPGAVAGTAEDPRQVGLPDHRGVIDDLHRRCGVVRYRHQYAAGLQRDFLDEELARGAMHPVDPEVGFLALRRG